MNVKLGICWSDLFISRMDESTQPWSLLKACCEYSIRPVVATDGAGMDHVLYEYQMDDFLRHCLAELQTALPPAMQDSEDELNITPHTQIMEKDLKGRVVTTARKKSEKSKRVRKVNDQNITIQ